MTNCAICGKPAVLTTKWRRDLLHATGRGYCSPECAQEWKRRSSSATVAATNRRYASARMTARNPMRLPDVRERMAATKRGCPWKGPRGGNGRPAPKAQSALAAALGWPMEVVVVTGNRPAHYKLDIAHVGLKVAIEVDGSGHSSLRIRAADERKAAFLRGQGWTVLRFTNAQVLADVTDCARMVTSTISKSQEPTRTPPPAS